MTASSSTHTHTHIIISHPVHLIQHTYILRTDTEPVRECVVVEREREREREKKDEDKRSRGLADECEPACLC